MLSFLGPAHDRSLGPVQDRLSVGVIVVAYNAASTLASVLDRIPADFRSRVAEVVVCDDASTDSTYAVGVDYKQGADLPLTVIRRPRNLGYGGNQKAAYLWAIERGLDIVVLLHGDGQYAPEVIEDLVAPFDDPDVDAVFGSRMLQPGAARRGGMPLYKYVGNRILSRFANRVTGMDLSEWHSGYRAYRVAALGEVPFEQNSDGFDFDTEIILQLHEAGRVIVEVPIPTFYGDEICYVNGLRYARDVVEDILRYRMRRVGFDSGEKAFSYQRCETNPYHSWSHLQILRRLEGDTGLRVLDLGCSDGKLGGILARSGHTVIGVDAHEIAGVRERLSSFVRADLNRGIPTEVGRGFDVVLAAGILEHLVDPSAVLHAVRPLLAPGGRILVSVPDFAHWYVRLGVASGRFDYDRRGIPHSGHLRFFTARSLERMAARSGMTVRRCSLSDLPVEVTGGGAPAPRSQRRVISASDNVGLAVAPGLFGYQALFELVPTAGAEQTADEPPALEPMSA